MKSWPVTSDPDEDNPAHIQLEGIIGSKKEWEEWEALHRAMDDKERRDEVQRVARIAANKILWATSRRLESPGKEFDDEAIVAQVTEPAGHHQVRPPSPMEDEVFLPNTYYSVPNPLKFTTSKETTFLAHDTVVDREKTKVATAVVDDIPEVDV